MPRLCIRRVTILNSGLSFTKKVMRNERSSKFCSRNIWRDSSSSMLNSIPFQSMMSRARISRLTFRCLMGSTHRANSGLILTVSKCNHVRLLTTHQWPKSINSFFHRLVLPTRMSVETTTQSTRQLPWETSRRTRTCKLLFWMTGLKAAQQTFQAQPLLNLCSKEES